MNPYDVKICLQRSPLSAGGGGGGGQMAVVALRATIYQLIGLFSVPGELFNQLFPSPSSTCSYFLCKKKKLPFVPIIYKRQANIFARQERTACTPKKNASRQRDRGVGIVQICEQPLPNSHLPYPPGPAITTYSAVVVVLVVVLS